MSCLAKMAEKMRMDDEPIFGITKLKLQAFSLAALEMILGDIVVKVSSMMDIPDICHERHEHGRVNFFWPV